ncbi:MAG: thiamine pyrophosphate-dependent enzyme, partial [Variovorax sp.]
PLLMLPGDVFASRAPDPVLQQLEDLAGGDVSVNDAFRPLTRYFDRLTRPEQLLMALPQAIQVMLDPATCGPVCLALPQDVQAQAFDCPSDFLAPEPVRIRRPAPDAHELHDAITRLRRARRPLIVAGGGVLYSQAWQALDEFARRHGVPVAETQAGKSSLAWNHPLNVGAIGVTGSPAANALAHEADLVLAVGTRLQDFTTGSHSLFAQAQLLGINVQSHDARKWHGQALVADARVGLTQLSSGAADWHADTDWSERARQLAAQWLKRVDALTLGHQQTLKEVHEAPPVTATDMAQAMDGLSVLRKAPATHDPPLDTSVLPYDAEVIGAVRDSVPTSDVHDVVVCAAGTLPAELHKLWRAGTPGNYHVEYGYSCMGYEIAGGLGVKLARPQSEVIVMVGDGSYLMLNSEIATSVMLGLKLIIVVLDNRGFGCIERLQQASGSAHFNNMLQDCLRDGGSLPAIDFAMHARSLGAEGVHVGNIAELGVAMVAARSAKTTQVIVIDTTHLRTTDDGGCWWEVAIPEVSARAEVDQARAAYIEAKKEQQV